jgi:hypothetical protein
VFRLIAFEISLLMIAGCSSTSGFDCKELAEIRQIPFKGEQVDDAAYNAITSKNRAQLEADLVECVGDTTPMPDPRQAPPYPGFVVGDVAVFILSDASGVPIEELLPDEFRATWPEEGIYSYFKYVSSDSNRQALEGEWRQRLSLSKHGE